MSMSEPITVEDYKNVADEFFSKYNFVVERLGPGAESNGSNDWCRNEGKDQRKSRTFWI